MRDTLEKALVANPDDLAAHAAYADLLMEEGDPRGEFIQVQLALEEEGRPSSERQQLARREKELLTKHRRAWLGGLAPYFLGRRDPPAYLFRRGWLHALHIVHLRVEQARRLAAAPELRLLHELRIESTTCEAEDKYKPGADVPHAAAQGMFPGPAPLAGSPYLSNVRRLMLGRPVDLTDLRWDLNGMDFCGEAAVPLVTSLPRLEDLSINLANPESFTHVIFETKQLPAPRALALYNLDDPEVDRLARNPAFDTLERLTLHLRRTSRESYRGLDALRLQALFRSMYLQSLRELTLIRTMLGDAGCEAVVASKVWNRLKVLSLPLGTITNRSATIFAADPAFGRMELVDLSFNRLTKRGIEALERANPRVLTDHQFHPRGYDPEEASLLFDETEVDEMECGFGEDDAFDEIRE